MDEGQNAITDLSPVNTALENLFLVFIFSYTLLIPLKQISPHKRWKQSKKVQAIKTQNNENQPAKKFSSSPPNQTKKPYTKNKAKPKQNCKDNFCSLTFI